MTLRQWLKRVTIFLRQPLAKKVTLLVLGIWILTIVGFAVGLNSSPNKFVISLFQSWTGDVIFFSIVGALLTVISSAPAALEPFEERASILFQGQNGSQVDYAKSQLNRLGNYSEETHTTILIKKDDGDWFRLVSNSKAKVRNLIEDVETTYLLPVSYVEQLANPPGKIGAVLSFAVDGQDQVSQQIEPGMEGNYSVTIGGENAREIKIVRDYWIGRNGFIAHSPARFTKNLSLSVINQSENPVFLKLIGPKKGSLIELGAREKSSNLVELQDIEPMNLAYKFYLFRTKEDARRWRRTPRRSVSS
jgi:hypothetical protein